MALTEPFNLLTGFPGWVTNFDLEWRQERSRQASGVTIVKDMGSPLWRMAAQTKSMRPNALDYWRATLNSMENGLATFYGYSLSRTYPILYPNGSWPTGVAFNGLTSVLNSVNVNRKAVTLGALPAGYVVSVGDYISIDGDLHQAMETATASGAGITGEFEVRPHLWPGVVAGPAVFVAVKTPSCIMSIIPDSITSQANLNGWGVIAFQAIEMRE